MLSVSGTAGAEVPVALGAPVPVAPGGPEVVDPPDAQNELNQDWICDSSPAGLADVAQAVGQTPVGEVLKPCNEGYAQKHDTDVEVRAV